MSNPATITITITLDEEQRKAIAWVRDTDSGSEDDSAEWEERVADAQEACEHLEGFVELAEDEYSARDDG